MTEAASSFEGLLREALTPVEPPEDLVERLESTLTSITEMAVDELEAWELSAMRDPRNWARPAAALVVGSAAGTALVLLRARRRAQSSRGRLPELSRRRPAGCSAVAEAAGVGERSRANATCRQRETVQLRSQSRTWPPATAIPRARRGSRAPTAAGRSARIA